MAQKLFLKNVITPIFLIGISVIVTQTVFAMPESDPKAAFEYSKYVVIGEISSVEFLSEPSSQMAGFAIYEVDVKKYLKNPISNSTLKILGHYVNDVNPRSTISEPYQINQKVLLYIQKLEHVPGYDLIIRDSTSKVIKESIFRDIFLQKLPLYDQIKIVAHPDYLYCNNEDLVLSERPNGKLACVYASTAEKLEWKLIQ